MSLDPNEFSGVPPADPGAGAPTFQPTPRQFLPSVTPWTQPSAGNPFMSPPTPLQPGMVPGMDGSDPAHPLGADDLPQVAIYPAQVDYNVPMDAQERMDLGHLLIAEIEKYYQDVSPRLRCCEDWRADNEMIQADGDGPWKESARIRAPLTENAARNHHTRLNQQIIHSVPPFVVEAKSEQAIDAAPQIEEALTAQLEEADWKSVADEVHSELPIVGNVFVQVTFDQEIRRVPRHQLEWDPEIYAELLQAGLAPTQAMQEAVKTDRQGKAKVRLTWQNILKSSGVRFQVVKFEDGLIFPANIRSPQDCRGIGQRMVLRGADLKQGAKRGHYIKEEVADLLEHPSDAPAPGRDVQLNYQAVQADAGSACSADYDPLNREYLVYELCYLMDANGDDELEWVVVTVHESGRILRLQWLPYHHGEPFYVMFRYFTRARELFGMGVAEKIAVLQDAATAILCQLVDHADLSMNVFGNLIYEKSSGFKPDNFEWRMGKPIPCENVEGVKPLTVNPLPPEHYQLYQLFKDMADLTTATSNPSLGQTTDSAKTLGEVQIVSGNSNMIFEEVASKVARDWAKVWDQVRWLCGQYGDGGQVKYRKTALPNVTMQGEDGSPVPATMMGGQLTPAPGGATFDTIPSHMMLEDVDLVPAGLKQLADMQSRVQQASLVQSTLLEHPLVGQSIDAQVIMLDEYLQALRYPQRDKLMDVIHQVAAQVKQQQLLQAQMQQAMLMQGAATGASGAPQGAPGPHPGQSLRPQDQGPQGAPQGFPQGGAATGPGGIPLPPQPGGQRS